MSQKIKKINNKSANDIEEMLVYVEIEPTSMSESQIKEAVRLKMVGNEKKILLQINNRFFEGNFDYSIGTHVFFEKDEDATVDPLYGQCDSYYRYVTKTNKVLKTNRVLLKEQDTDEADTELVKEIEKETSELKLTRTYEEALNLFLPPGKNPPRKISSSEDIDRTLFTSNENQDEVITKHEKN